MDRSTIPIRLRLGFPEILLIGLLTLCLSESDVRGAGDRPARSHVSQSIKASRPLRSSVSRAPSLKPQTRQKLGTTRSPISDRSKSVIQTSHFQQNPAGDGEFDYPLAPSRGTTPSVSPEEAPSVVDPLFDSLVPEGAAVTPEPGFFQPEYYFPDQWTEHSQCENCEDGCFGRCSPWYRLFHLGIDEPQYENGIGEERVMLAPFTVDVSQPQKNYRLRLDMVSGLPFPDRAEYFFPNPNKGPKYIERKVNYQDIRFQFETGGPLFSVFTDLPVRVLDPEINDNTAGFGDMVVGNKGVLINGRFWQLTQVMRTYINTANPKRGLGTGHTSLEPGLILRYKWTDKTYLHSELKYFTPVGGDPAFSGPLLKYGFSWATVLYQTDSFAIMPSMEFTGTTILDGQRTIPLAVAVDGSIPNVDPTKPVLGQFPYVGQSVDIDSSEFGTIQTGVRFVLGPKGDLGLLEVGVSGAISTANNAFFDERAIVELRWSY